MADQPVQELFSGVVNFGGAVYLVWGIWVGTPHNHPEHYGLVQHNGNFYAVVGHRAGGGDGNGGGGGGNGGGGGGNGDGGGGNGGEGKGDVRDALVGDDNADNRPTTRRRM